MCVFVLLAISLHLLVVKSLICLYHKLQEPNLELVVSMSCGTLEDCCMFAASVADLCTRSQKAAFCAIFLLRNARLGSAGLGEYFPRLCSMSTDTGWIHLYDNSMSPYQVSRERRLRLCTVIMVLPAVGMNTDHVVSLGPASNCSCCNLS